jgi:putative ABC transport system permease protein
VRVTPDISVPGDAAVIRPPVRILTNPVSPGWFRTFGTRLLAGRDFEASDRLGAANVVVVNQAFARRYLGEASPLGRVLVETYAGADRRQLEIVGLAEDAAFTSVRDSVEPTLYRPLAQEAERWQATFPGISVSMRMRPGASPGRLKTKVIDVISGVDPALLITFRTVSQELSAYYIRERLLAWLSGFFGAVAILLAALGLYGVTAYAVARRRAEIGIRMALGATQSGVVRLVLSRVTMMVAIGVAVGAGISLWASTFVATLLYGLEPRDPVTLAGAVLVLGVVGLAAGWLPAHRASRIDPAEVLRDS